MISKLRAAIEDQVRRGAEGAVVEDEFRGRVEVDGHEIEYKGYGRGDTINIGICGPLYEGSKIAGVGAVSFLLPEVAPAALGRVATFGRYASGLGDAAYESVLQCLAAHPKARWIVEHAESVYKTGSVVAEYLKWIGRGMG